MTAFSYYLLKVIICSGILFLYYHVALRNKLFHQWNRFYLLISVLVSLVAPVIQVGIIQYTSYEPSKAIRILQVFQSADGDLEDVIIRGHKGISADQWWMTAYIALSCILFAYLVVSLRKIIFIIRSHTIQWIEKIKFVNTKIDGTPFTFFNFIFWNDEIDLQTETGRQIFQHELVHVKEKHTLDKILIQLVLVVFWCNPFFWLLRRELRLIHEFIADKKAVGEHGTAALAAMILNASYPTRFHAITNQFFQTSIKRRLVMLTKIQNPRINYVSRVLALPILTATVLAFTLRTKNIVSSPVKLDKQYTVVIDAGHGLINGKHSGAADGDVYEDGITLAIAKKIKELNSNNQLKIVLTRLSEENVDLHKRVDIAKENNADLFISLHVNALPVVSSSGKVSDSNNPKNGFEVLVSGKSTAYQKESEVLASAMQQELSAAYATNPSLIKPNAAVWVLDQNICPSILIECGFITDKTDKEFITKANNQSVIAQKMLKAIERYAQNQQGNGKTSSGVVTGEEQKSSAAVTAAPVSQANKGKSWFPDTTKKQPLFIVNGKEMSSEEAYKIDPANIESISVLKGNSALGKYGKKGANGVVEIKLKEEKAGSHVTVDKTPATTGVTTQPASESFWDTIPTTKPLFTKVETEATVDKEEWSAFLRKKLQSIIENAASCGMKPGTYVVNLRFIVKEDGSLTDIQSLNDPGYDLAQKTIAFMKDSPKWTPGMQNGKPVNSYHTQPVTLVVQEQ